MGGLKPSSTLVFIFLDKRDAQAGCQATNIWKLQMDDEPNLYLENWYLTIHLKLVV